MPWHISERVLDFIDSARTRCGLQRLPFLALKDWKVFVGAGETWFYVFVRLSAYEDPLPLGSIEFAENDFHPCSTHYSTTPRESRWGLWQQPSLYRHNIRSSCCLVRRRLSVHVKLLGVAQRFLQHLLQGWLESVQGDVSFPVLYISLLEQPNATHQTMKAFFKVHSETVATLIVLLWTNIRWEQAESMTSRVMWPRQR